MVDDKQKMIAAIIAGILTLLIGTVVTYAFFSARVTKNNETQTNLKSNTLGLIYTGVTDIEYESMIPGDSFKKTFTVENTSNRAVEYNIYMENVTNEYNEDLVYKILKGSEVVVDETPLPQTNTGKSYLKTSISIDASEIQEYTMIIEYKYKETSQNTYQGAVFKGTVGIDTELVDATYSLSGTVYKNINGEKTLVTEGNLVFYSDKQDIAITSEGKFNATNLETGMHKVYYMGNIDATNLTKEEIESQALCTADFKMATSGNEIILECKNNDELSLADLEIKKNKKAQPISFAVDSWETINDAVASGVYPYKVGDEKVIKIATHESACASDLYENCIAGSIEEKEVTIRLANVSQCDNTLQSKTACGFVVEFVDVIEKYSIKLPSADNYNKTTDGWEKSSVREYLNGDLFNALPTELQKYIKETVVVSGHGSTETTNFVTNDKMYLLNSKEVYGENQSTLDSSDDTTRQLDYYLNKGVTISNYDNAIKKYDGSGYAWYLRSPIKFSDNSWKYVDYNGYGNMGGALEYVKGISPAFRIN